MDISSVLREQIGDRRFKTVLADPPWRFVNRTGKMAPEHRRLSRYQTLSTREVCAVRVSLACEPAAHLYLWVPNALFPEGLEVLRAWGFVYNSKSSSLQSREPAFDVS
ncbi:MAG: hypothetical protein IT531_06080 [Burkholderiales bacterium]|nr:hypothetical protein [Burkholderiales bacterium]